MLVFLSFLYKRLDLTDFINPYMQATFLGLLSLWTCEHLTVLFITNCFIPIKSKISFL